MPGLSQLKKFTKDVSSLGDEEKVRIRRGDPYIPITVPEGIADVDDSDDFILGMPLPPGEQSSSTTSDEGDEFLPGDSVIPEEILSPGSEDNNTETVLEDLSPVEENTSASSPFTLPEEDLSLDALNDFIEPEKETTDVDSDMFSMDNQSFEDVLGDLGSFSDIDTSTNDEIPSADSDVFSAPEDFSLNDDFSSPENFSVPDSESPEELESLSSPDELSDDLEDFGELEDLDEVEAREKKEKLKNLAPSEDVDASAFSIDDNTDDDFDFNPDAIPDMDISMDEIQNKVNLTEAGDTILPGTGLDSTIEEPVEGYSDSSFSDNISGSEGMDFDLDSVPDANIDLSSISDSSSGSSDIEFNDEGADDISSNDIMDVLGNDEFGPIDEVSDLTPGVEGLDSFPDFGELDSVGDDSGLETGNSAEPSSMDDFATTDEALSSSIDDGLDDFEIPGYSDNDGNFEFNDKGFIEDKKKEEPEQRTSLTDEEYKLFTKHLKEYPLNLRMELEKLISSEDFKDDAVFAVIEKVIKGSSAKQVASHLSKYLDISVSIPRDYERRTAEQYDAYKKSIEYQLKNRIIPICLAAVALFFLGWGIFFMIQRFVYRPVMADMLYKEGYELLDNNLFPQSEIKFNQAVTYKPKKKWFLKYAEGYCGKKQYDRSRRMYENTLLRFKHDKTAGINYANMELNELYNYSRAEEIVKREILDYHINDPDALLLLGDIYLEWATEKDPSKFKNAYDQYMELVNLFGNNDIYTTRFMRYFIRTDNLREVLPLKTYFYGKKKNVLGASDLTELSCYLLDKLYGYLPPADEYLRSQIENVRQLLEMAVEADKTVPEPHYNLARYFVYTDNDQNAEILLNSAIKLYNSAKTRKPKQILKHIDSYRLLGNIYTKQQQYILAEETYGEGIMLFEEEEKNSFLKSNEKVGHLYSDMGDLDYFISGDIDDAMLNYTKALSHNYNNASVNYKVGFIHYANKDYDDSLKSFIKASEEKPEDKNLLYSLGNVLALRNDDYSAQGYYERLIDMLDLEMARAGLLLPQVQTSDGLLVDLYMKASNNLGVVLNRLAKRTGDSELNAAGMYNLSESLRAWDALTRNQTTMVRLEGSNLAAQNMKYMSHPYSDFEPAIYTSIPRVLDGERVLEQSFVK